MELDAYGAAVIGLSIGSIIFAIAYVMVWYAA